MNFSPQAAGLLKAVCRLSRDRKIKLYLVGGYLRDALLSRKKENPDIDFCLKKNAISFGRRLAKELKSGFVVLDDEHGACRVVKKIKDKVYTLDFTDFRGDTLEEDLLGRDFTINTLALDLERAVGLPRPLDFLIDLYGGCKDIKNKVIRAANSSTFDQDPLRLLRAFSFSCIFGFKIEKETLKLIKLKKNKLKTVSFERIRDELFKILDAPDGFGYLVELDKIGILKIIFPEIEVMRGVNQGPYHHLDVWAHTLEVIRQLEAAVGEHNKNEDTRDYLNTALSTGRKRRALLKLAALLHDIGKPKARRRQKDGKITFWRHEKIGSDIARDVAERLKLSNDEWGALKKMVFWHLRPGYLADSQEATPRAKFRYFRDTADEAASILLLSLADQRATKGRLTTPQSRLAHEKTVASLLKEYFRRKKEKKIARLINGDDLIKKFKLTPSPLIGKVLRQTEELQAIGRIKTKQEALKAAAKIIAKSRRNEL